MTWHANLGLQDWCQRCGKTENDGRIKKRINSVNLARAGQAQWASVECQVGEGQSGWSSQLLQVDSVYWNKYIIKYMFQFTSCCQVVLWIHMRKRVDPDHCGWLYSEYSHTLPCAYLSNQTRLHMNHNEFQIKSLLSCQIPPRMLSLQSQVPSVLTLYTPRFVCLFSL